MSKQKQKKPKKASSLNKKTNRRKQAKHKCGEINGVMGQGSFARERNQFRCVECGNLHDELPKDYVDALKKLNPKKASLLLKGAKKSGEKNPIMVEAGKKAWETRRANEAKAKKNKAKKHK